MAIPIYVGYDDRERVGYTVFCSSVLRRTKEAVSFHPMRGGKVEGSTQFNPERFKIPEEQEYRGWAIWAESDMLCLGDVAELMEFADPKYDVLVAPHSYKTKFPVKFLGQSNPDYPGKNRTSLMLINCNGAVWQRLMYADPPLTLSQLHRLPKTIPSEGRAVPGFRVGDLPLEWNWLVQEYDYNPKAKLAHFTIGIPPFYPDCDYASDWNQEMREATSNEHWDATELVSER
jgi:hypothetical protein